MGLHFQEGASILPERMQFVFPIEGTSGGTARESNTVVDYSKATALQLTALGAPHGAKIVNGEAPLTGEALAVPLMTSQVLVVFQNSNPAEIVQAMTTCLEGEGNVRRPFSLMVVFPSQEFISAVWENIAPFLDEHEIGCLSADSPSSWASFRRMTIETE